MSVKQQHYLLDCQELSSNDGTNAGELVVINLSALPERVQETALTRINTNTQSL
jgi:hypothetical protein